MCYWGCGEKIQFGGNVNWYSHYEKQYSDFLNKLRIELPYYPNIPLLGICVKNIKTFEKKIYVPQSSSQHYLQYLEYGNNLLMDEWVKKMWYIQTMKYYSPIRKNKPCHLQQHGWTLRVLH